MTTWMELAEKLKKGDRVRFTREHDIFPDYLVKAGLTATVVEMELNEMTGLLYVRPDSPEAREALKTWDGNIVLSPAADTGDPYDDVWADEAPVEIVA